MVIPSIRPSTSTENQTDPASGTTSDSIPTTYKHGYAKNDWKRTTATDAHPDEPPIPPKTRNTGTRKTTIGDREANGKLQKPKKVQLLRDPFFGFCNGKDKL